MTTITNKKVIKIKKSLPVITMYHWIEDLLDEEYTPMRYQVYKQSKKNYFVKMIDEDWIRNVKAGNPKQWKRQPLYAVIMKEQSRPW